MCNPKLLKSALDRYAEFGRAVVEGRLKDKVALRYVGCLLETQAVETTALIRDRVHKVWDSSAEAPPRKRPTEETSRQTPPLKLLAWANDRPVWPASLSERFAPGTNEHAAIATKKAEFDTAFPEASQTSATPVPSGGRAGGACDFSIDAGAKPVNVAQEFALTVVKDEDFTETRCISHDMPDLFDKLRVLCNKSFRSIMRCRDLILVVIFEDKRSFQFFLF